MPVSSPPSGWITVPIAPRRLFVASSHPGQARAFDGLPVRELVARLNCAVVRQASLFVGATDRSQAPFIDANFGEEEHSIPIGGLLHRYCADAGARDDAPA